MYIARIRKRKTKKKSTDVSMPPDNRRINAAFLWSRHFQEVPKVEATALQTIARTVNHCWVTSVTSAPVEATAQP